MGHELSSTWPQRLSPSLEPLSVWWARTCYSGTQSRCDIRATRVYLSHVSPGSQRPTGMGKNSSVGRGSNLGPWIRKYTSQPLHNGGAGHDLLSRFPHNHRRPPSPAAPFSFYPFRRHASRHQHGCRWRVRRMSS